MGVVFQIIAAYAPYIYLVCGLVALYQLYRVWLVRGERRQAVFSLEREKAIRDLGSIFTVAMVLLVVMGITYFASSTLPKAAEPGAILATPEPTLPSEFVLVITPTTTPLPATPSATPTATVTPTAAPPTPEPAAATQTAAALPPPTPTPEEAPPPQGAAPACPDQRAIIASPGNGAVVNGVFTLTGTATHEQFSYYKVEFAPGANAEGGFTYLADGRSPVFNGALASVDTRGLGNGPWTFQLTVVDQTGNFPPPCRVSVTVQN